MTTDVKWFAFVDWASRKHQLCLLDADGRLIGQQAFAHSGAGLAHACDWLLAKSGVQRRLACNKRLRNALYHWARVAAQNDPRFRQRYADLRRHRGRSHARALRTVGDALPATTCAMLKTRTFFDPNRHSSKHAIA